MPYVFLVDDAIPLSKDCLRSYSQSDLTPIKHISNYRLSWVAELLKMLLEF